MDRVAEHDAPPFDQAFSLLALLQPLRPATLLQPIHRYRFLSRGFAATETIRLLF